MCNFVGVCCCIRCNNDKAIICLDGNCRWCFCCWFVAEDIDCCDDAALLLLLPLRVWNAATSCWLHNSNNVMKQETDNIITFGRSSSAAKYYRAPTHFVGYIKQRKIMRMFSRFQSGCKISDCLFVLVSHMYAEAKAEQGDKTTQSIKRVRAKYEATSTIPHFEVAIRMQHHPRHQSNTM